MKQSGKKSFSSLRRGQFFRLLRGTSMNDVRRFLAIFDLPKPTNFWEIFDPPPPQTNLSCFFLFYSSPNSLVRFLGESTVRKSA